MSAVISLTCVQRFPIPPTLNACVANRKVTKVNLSHCIYVDVFTARPEAQRCQVTPYVVNVVVVVGGRVTDSEIKVLPAF